MISISFCSAESIMVDDLMFAMEEDGSAKRPPVQRNTQRSCSLSDEDDDDDEMIFPILHDSEREICEYLKNKVNAKQQLSNSLPKSNFQYRVRTQYT